MTSSTASQNLKWNHFTLNYRVIYILALSCIAFGLSTSTVLMSVGQFALGFVVFIHPNVMQNLKKIFSFNWGLFWLGFFTLYMISGLNSQNMDYFWNDIRTKIPLFSFPLAVVAYGAPNAKELKVILYSFISSLLISAFWAFKIYFFSSDSNIIDYRDLSPIISHIRMGLFLVLAIFICLPLILKAIHEKKILEFLFLSLALVILSVYLILLKSSTSIPVFIACLVSSSLFLLIKKAHRKIIFIIFVCFAGLFIFIGFRVKKISDLITSTETIHAENLPLKTAQGNLYEHYLHRTQFENGHAVWINICSLELRELWNQKSAIPYDGKDKKGNRLDGTLIRYMSSKGLHKDAEGFSKMSSEDIRNVENGIANYLYEGKFNIDGRIHEILWELNAYRSDADPNGRSMSQRIELWKASRAIIQLNFWSGVGAGDVRDVLKKSLTAMDSKLRYHKQFGPHNQYLCTIIAIGFPALFWLLFCLLLPFFRGKAGFFYLIIFTITIVSMMNEDMFETQAAITFIMFFVSIFQSSEMQFINSKKA